MVEDGCVVGVVCDVGVVTELVVDSADCDDPLPPHPTRVSVTTRQPPRAVIRHPVRSSAIPECNSTFGLNDHGGLSSAPCARRPTLSECGLRRWRWRGTTGQP